MENERDVGATPWTYEELPSVEDRSILTASIHDAEGIVLADVEYPEFGPLMAAAPELLESVMSEKAFWEHYANCRRCMGKTFCGDALELRADAIIKQRKALAKTREGCDG